MTARRRPEGSGGATARGRDAYAGALGRLYSWYIEHEAAGRLVGRAVWSSDFRPMYRELRGLADLPRGAHVLDVPCGAGLALRWLDPARPGRYVGVDSSPAMLARAWRTARRRGVAHIELFQADIAALPLESASFDICLLYNGLHCVDDPRAAVADVVRCLRPGGQLRGSMLVRGARRRADRALARDATRPDAMTGAGGTVDDLRAWLADAGLRDIEVSTSGAMALFRART